MCGVAGMVRFDGEPAQTHVLRSMADAVVHRGPDGDGVYVDGAFGLAHRRLAIIDLTDHGAQPMAWQDRYVMSFNGEVYNYIELREELAALGHEFDSTGDTQVVLAAFAQWGEQCTSRFNGMWSLLIYDRVEQTLFASRDRFGIKPLYYLHNTSFIAFGSELKQLLPLQRSRQVNHNSLADFMVLGLANHSAQTMFADLMQLPPGHSMTVQVNGEIAIQQYYQLSQDPDLLAFDDKAATEIFEQTFTDSIRLRLRSDVTVGSCLSGGLDSSTLCALASQRNPGLRGITATSTDPDKDESAWARTVAEHCDMTWHPVAPTHPDFMQDMRKLAFVQEEPFPTPSIFLQYRVFQEAAAAGCKVMLDGQGGDETLLGYERYFVPHLLSVGPLRIWPEILNVARNSKLRIGDVLKYLAYFRSAALRKRVLARRAREHLSDEAIASTNWEWLDRIATAYRHPNTTAQLEISQTQLPHLLMYEDKNSMAHSIESRLPFLDYRLVELSVSLAHRMKVRDGWSKWILRKCAERHLPATIAWRRNKIGFEAPAKQLLSLHNADIEQCIADSRIWHAWRRSSISPAALSASAKWAWLSIAMWEQAYDVSV